jgi:hypothetical protein
MLAIMHMPGSMFDGHHPFPWLLCMPLYKSKWSYVHDQRVLSLVKVSLDLGLPSFIDGFFFNIISIKYAQK